MLEFLCPKCRKRLRVDEGLAGKQGRCPSCRSTITIPEPSQALKPTTPAGPNEEADMPMPTEVLVSPPIGMMPKAGTSGKSATPAPAAEKKPAPAPVQLQAAPRGGLARKLLLVAIPIIVVAAAILVYYFCFRK